MGTLFSKFSFYQYGFINSLKSLFVIGLLLRSVFLIFFPTDYQQEHSSSQQQFIHLALFSFIGGPILLSEVYIITRRKLFLKIALYLNLSLLIVFMAFVALFLVKPPEDDEVGFIALAFVVGGILYFIYTLISQLTCLLLRQTPTKVNPITK